jgi:hypothetical protein
MQNYVLLFPIIAIFLLVLGVLAIHWSNLNIAEEKITKYLLDRGGTNLEIQRDWLNFDRYSLTFNVKYTGISGNERTTRCKLQVLGIFVSDEIFWSDPVLDLEVDQIGGQGAESFGTLYYRDLSEKIHSQLGNELPTYSIVKVLSIADSSDKIVLFDYSKSFSNVIRCKPDGSVAWRAELPTASNDAYTNIEWKDSLLVGFSKSCVSVTFDLETGKIIF